MWEKNWKKPRWGPVMATRLFVAKREGVVSFRLAYDYVLETFAAQWPEFTNLCPKTGQ